MIDSFRPKAHTFPMRKRLAIFILLCTGALVGARSIDGPGQVQEPRYGGVPLTTLLENAVARGVPRQPTMGRHDGGWMPDPVAEDAVRNTGTNALPYLVSMVQDGSSDRSRLAMNAFRLLGPTATPAIAPLERIAQGPYRDEVVSGAVTCLGNIGNNSLPALSRLSTNDQTRLHAIASIIQLGMKGAPIQSVVAAIIEPGDLGAQTAVMGLRNLPATNAIPILTNVLTHPNPRMRETAAAAIGFGSVPEFRSAIPLLVACAQDPDAKVRRAATDALRRLAPEMFVTNAPASRRPSAEP